MKVTILRIAHKHGLNYWLYPTQEDAQYRLANWVREWWPQELPDEPMPKDEQELVDAYFELCPPEESWEMTPDEEIVGLAENNRWAIYDFDDETMLSHVYDDYDACVNDANQLDNSMIIGVYDGRCDSGPQDTEPPDTE